MNSGRYSIRWLAKCFFHGLGLDVRSLKHANTEDAVIRNLFRIARPVAVLDVGANIGQYAERIRASGYNDTIVSFEALPLVHARLLETAKKDPRWIVAPCGALGSERGDVEINIASNTVSSSLLPMMEVHRRAAPESAYIGKQTVSVARLDQVISGLLSAEGNLFLKIDTQGYEKEVLKGSSSLLPRIAAMQLELSLIPLYENAPTFVDMVSYVESLGYALFSLVPGFRDDRTGRIYQVDGFFIRGALEL